MITKPKNKKNKSILQKRLVDAKIKTAVSEYNEKRILQKLDRIQKFKFYFKKYLKVCYILFVNFRIYNYLIYGFCAMLVLTLLSFSVSWFQFLVGVALYSLYDLITEDWRKE